LFLEADVGKLRLSHASSPALAADSVAQMPPPAFKSPLQPVLPITTSQDPSRVLTAPSSVPKGVKRKEPESAFSDSSLSDVTSGSRFASQQQKGEESEDDRMKEGSAVNLVDQNEERREDSPEAPPSINGNGNPDEEKEKEKESEKKKQKGKEVVEAEDPGMEEPSTTEESMERELSPMSSLPEDEEEESREEEEEPITPARRKSTRSRASTATTQRSTPASSSSRKPRGGRASTGGRRGRSSATPQVEEEVVEAEQGGIAAAVKNRRRKAARLT